MSRFQIFLFYLIFTFLITGVGFVSSQISEEAAKNLDYPIAELGNCKDQKTCEVYCDKSENTEACLNFAEANNLMPREEIEMARKMLALGITAGPGGCQSQTECDAYCNSPANMAECIIFGRDNGLIPPEELAEAEMALAAIQKGVTPPPCRGKAACDDYCSEPANLEVCMTFAEAAGFVTPEEAEMIRKTGGKGPGSCKGKDTCDAYCQESANMEECINFGLQYGLIPPDEVADVQKMLEAIKKGVNPPNCRGKAECDVYCSQPENGEECINFAVAAGFMTAEESEMALKMAKLGIFGGPGGCKGKEECESFCDNPDNMTECVDFAVKAGMMTPEEAEQAQKMTALGITSGPGGCKEKEECEAFCQDPANGEECMNFAVQTGMMSPEEAAQIMQQMSSPSGGGMMGPEGSGGPGDPGGMPPEGWRPGMEIPEGMQPPEGMTQPPSPEQIQQMIQQQTEQMMQQQIQQQMEQMQQQMTPPPAETSPPQSLLNQTKLFLANFLSAFQISR